MRLATFAIGFLLFFINYHGRLAWGSEAENLADLASSSSDSSSPSSSTTIFPIPTPQGHVQRSISGSSSSSDDDSNSAGNIPAQPNINTTTVQPEPAAPASTENHEMTIPDDPMQIDPTVIYVFDAAQFFRNLDRDTAHQTMNLPLEDPVNAAALTDPACIRAIRRMCEVIPTSWFRKLLLADPTLIADETIKQILRGECLELMSDYGWIQPGDPLHRIPLIAWDALQGSIHTFQPIVLLELLERDPDRLDQSFLRRVIDMYSRFYLNEKDGSGGRLVTPPVQLRFLLLLKQQEWPQASFINRHQLREHWEGLVRAVASNKSALHAVPGEKIVAAALVIVRVLRDQHTFGNVLSEWQKVLSSRLCSMPAVLEVAQQLLISVASNDLHAYHMRNLFEWLLRHNPQIIPLELIEWAFRVVTAGSSGTTARRVKLIRAAVGREGLSPIVIDRILLLATPEELQQLIRRDANLLPTLLSMPLDSDTKLALIDLNGAGREDAGGGSGSGSGSGTANANANNQPVNQQHNQNNFNLINLINNDHSIIIVREGDGDGDDDDGNDDPLHAFLPLGLPIHQLLASAIAGNHHHHHNPNDLSNPDNFYEWLPMDHLIAIEKDQWIVHPDDILEDLKRRQVNPGSIDDALERKLYREACELAKAIKEDAKAKAQRLVHSTVQAFRESDGAPIANPSFRIRYVQETAQITTTTVGGNRNNQRATSNLDALDNPTRYRLMGNDQSALRKDWLHKALYLLGGSALGGVLEEHPSGGLVPVPFVGLEAMLLLGRMAGKMLQLRIRPGLHWHPRILALWDGGTREQDGLVDEPTLRILYPAIFARLDDLVATATDPSRLGDCVWEMYPSPDGQMLPFRLRTWTFEQPTHGRAAAVEFVEATSLDHVLDYVGAYTIQLGLHLWEAVMAFLRGMYRYFDFGRYRRFFTPSDWKHILLGPSDHALSPAQLFQALIYDHSCLSHQFINDLDSHDEGERVVGVRQAIELVVGSFSADQLAQFWNFFSPTPTIPIGGIASVRPTIVCTHLVEGRLPSASTCFYTIKIPRYPTLSMLRQRLLMAMSHGTDVAYED